MKKITVFLLMCMLFTVGSAAGKKKTADKEYNGEYVKATNTFTYKKDNLIFKDKILTYQLQDNSDLLNGIYEFMSREYGVTDDDIIGLNVVGKVSGGTLVVTKITNYRIPEYRMNGQDAGNMDYSTETQNEGQNAEQ